MSDEGLEPFDQPGTTCVDATDKAISVTFDDKGFSVSSWVPNSAIHDDSEVYRVGDEGTLVVFMWFARKREWI